MSNVTEEGLDKGGKEVLDELEKEGFEIAGREKPAPVTPAEEQKPKPEVKSPDETKPEAKPEAKPELKPEENKEQKPKIEEQKVERKVQHVPLPKYLDTERQLKEAQAKIEELSKNGAKPSEEKIADATEAVKTLVDKFGYDEENAKQLVEVFKTMIPGQTISPEVKKAMEALPLLDKMRSDLEKQQETAVFDQDFSKSVLANFPHLDKYKDQIKEMAYSEVYAKTPLRAVALAFMDAEGISQKPADVITSEKPGGGSNKGAETIDFDNITDDQFNKLTPEQQDQFFAHQEKKEKAARGALN